MGNCWLWWLRTPFSHSFSCQIIALWNERVCGYTRAPVHALAVEADLPPKQPPPSDLPPKQQAPGSAALLERASSLGLRGASCTTSVYLQKCASSTCICPAEGLKRKGWNQTRTKTSKKSSTTNQPNFSKCQQIPSRNAQFIKQRCWWASFQPLGGFSPFRWTECTDFGIVLSFTIISVFARFLFLLIDVFFGPKLYGSFCVGFGTGTIIGGSSCTQKSIHWSKLNSKCCLGLSARWTACASFRWFWMH